MLIRLLCVGAALAVICPDVVAAQFDVLSSVRPDEAIDSMAYVSAPAAKENVDALRTQAVNSVVLERTDYPTDSINRLVSGRAQQWVARLASMRLRGTQIDSYVQVALMAHDDRRAEQMLDTRLKVPTLSDEDRAYLLLLAVQGFADPATPSRLPMAEHYLSLLTAMGGKGWGFVRRVFAEDALLQAYDVLGKPADVTRHGIALVRLLPHISLYELFLFTNEDRDFYVRIASALALEPAGHAMLYRLDSVLLASTHRAADSVVLDSVNFRAVSDGLAQSIALQIAQAKRIGEIAAPIYSNYWINTADSSPHTLRVDDGKIRVVESGNRSCGPCLQAMSGLEHLQESFPDVQAVLITFTQGSWANRVLPATEEAKYVKDFYVNQRQLHYPIALWLAAKKPEADGSTVPDLSADSAQAQYPDGGGPLIYVLDGQGRIRYVRWTYNRGDEYKYLATVIRHLQVEAASTSGAGHEAATVGGRTS